MDEDNKQSYTMADEEVNPDYASIPLEADELDEGENDLSELGEMSDRELSTSEIDDAEALKERQEDVAAEDTEASSKY
jgi:hypothetical protein